MVIDAYLTELCRALEQIPVAPIAALIDCLDEARWRGGNVFVFGNGGSAATASHFACDLAKNTRQPGVPGIRATCLSDNIATLTAYANDEGYENVFAGPLSSLACPGDVAIAISASGNSPNILKGVDMAKFYKAKTVGLTGAGGKLAGMVDIAICVPAECIEQVEDAHLVICHAATRALGRMERRPEPSIKQMKES